MFNIHIKGKYENEEQLINGKKLPENAGQVREGESVSDAFKLGFLLSLPIMLPMIFFSIKRCSGVDNTLEFDIWFVFTVAITALLGQGLIYVHEFIHAMFYPKEAKKIVWKDTKQGAYFVYCDAPVSKARFIILCLAPCIVLGIIPFLIWYIVVPVLNASWGVCTMMLTWGMTFGAIGDFANVFNAVRQVPKKAKVFNYGMHTYWMECSDEEFNS